MAFINVKITWITIYLIMIPLNFITTRKSFRGGKKSNHTLKIKLITICVYNVKNSLTTKYKNPRVGGMYHRSPLSCHYRNPYSYLKVHKSIFEITYCTVYFIIYLNWDVGYLSSYYTKKPSFMRFDRTSNKNKLNNSFKNNRAVTNCAVSKAHLDE